jgi:alpha-beta hydrolase superfamily lysophospholipase
MEIIRKEYSIPSKTGIGNVYARCWVPADGVKAVLQIAHGMAEHGERYEDFAKYLCEKGIALFINDHLGHGKSVKSDDDLGYFGDNNGWNILVEDQKVITDLIKREFPDTPIVFFGHSMGSFIAREYVRRYGKDESLKAAVFCGTSGKNPASAIAIKLANAIAKIKGTKHHSKFIDKMAFGPYNAKTENRTPFDWLSRDQFQVDKYVADKYCGFLFTAYGYRDLTSLLGFVSGKKWFESLDKELPVLIISGAMDPVGNFGKGIDQVCEKLEAAGKKNFKKILYPDGRHEILNESALFDKVCEDVIEWIEETI